MTLQNATGVAKRSGRQMSSASMRKTSSTREPRALRYIAHRF